MIEFGIATALLIFTIMIGIPIAFAIGITSVLYIIMTNPGNTQVMLLRMFSGVDSFILMAIPLFVLAAEIMVRSGISTKLFNFVRLFVGRMRGGLAYVNVLVSTIFGSISGAALSDIAGLGLIEIESMKEDGYEHDFACAVTAVSSVQSTLIPPSNSAVLYGGIMSISVGALFIAGLVPGLLLAASQILYIALMSKKLGLPKRDEKYTKSEVIQIIKDGFIGIMMPIIILIGILGGFFTPTEAAGIAVAYSLIIGCFVYRNIKLEDIKEALWSSVKTSGNLFIIIAFSSAFSWALGMENVPDQIANYMLGISSNPKVLLFIVNILLIIIGMWMETGAAIILFAPILAPIMYKVGVHPVHFATVMLYNLNLGLITPPVGVVLYATASIGKIRFESLVKAAAPFIVMAFIVLILLTYFPVFSLYLPKVLGLID